VPRRAKPRGTKAGRPTTTPKIRLVGGGPTIPELIPCPRCGLALESGKNPDGLAWHECREGVELQATRLLQTEGRIDQAQAVDVLARLMIQRALTDLSPVDKLAAGVKALTSGRAASSEPDLSDAMRRWLSGPK